MKSLGIIENWNRRWLLENLNSAFWPFEGYRGGVQDCERIRSIIRGQFRWLQSLLGQNGFSISLTSFRGGLY